MLPTSRAADGRRGRGGSGRGPAGGSRASSAPDGQPTRHPAGNRATAARPARHTGPVPEPELSEQDYLRQIELLALDVVAAARGEGRIGYDADPPGATALQRAVDALAGRLRHQ